MHELFLGFWVLLAAAAQVVPLEPVIEAAPMERTAACEAARRMAEQGACLRPEDCGAFDGWMRLFGVPRTEPLTPSLADRDLRSSFPCLAPPATRPRPEPRVPGR